MKTTREIILEQAIKDAIAEFRLCTAPNSEKRHYWLAFIVKCKSQIRELNERKRKYEKFIRESD